MAAVERLDERWDLATIHVTHDGPPFRLIDFLMDVEDIAAVPGNNFFVRRHQESPVLLRA